MRLGAEKWKGQRNMTEVPTKASVTSHTIAIEHIRISSGRPFAEVRRKLEAKVPRLDTGIAEALRSGDQKRAKAYEESGSKLSIFGDRDHGACCRFQADSATRCNTTSAIPSPPQG
jgi:hypothetical protein